MGLLWLTPVFSPGFPLSVTWQVKHPMDMATVVVKLLDGDYKDEGGMVADLRLMVENCRRCV